MFCCLTVYAILSHQYFKCLKNGQEQSIFECCNVSSLIYVTERDKISQVNIIEASMVHNRVPDLQVSPVRRTGPGVSLHQQL